MSARIDVNTFLGAYPWRKVPGTSPEALANALDRVAIDTAWVTHLPGLFWRDPTEGNAWLYETAKKERRFKPVPTVHPGLAQWEQVLADAANAGAPAVRCDPLYLGLDPAGGEMRDDMLGVDDLDVVSGLDVACGHRAFALLLQIEQRNVERGDGLRPDYAGVIDRFVFGTGQPLRLPETSVAKLDLLELSRAAREAIESTNVQGLMA